MKTPDQRPGTGISFSEVVQKPASVTLFDISYTAYVDTSGVPLDSDRGDPEKFKGIDFRKRPNNFRSSPSRYPDGRPHEVPVSGLEQERLGRTMGEMMGVISYVRDNAILMVGGDPDKPIDAESALAITNGLAHLPSYLVFRADKPIPSEGMFPPYMFVLSNSASGTRAALAAWIREFGDEGKNVVPDSREMIEIIEQHGSMVKETVCAASPSQQEKFIDAIIYGPPEELTFPFNKELFSLSEIPAILEFGDAMNASNLAFQKLEQLDEDFFARIDEQTDQGSFSQAEYIKHFIGLVREFSSMVSQIGVQLSSIEEAANEILGRTPETRSDFSFAGLNNVMKFKIVSVLRGLQK